MSEEIEIKLKFQEHDVIRDRLRRAGATFLGQFFESNTFFDTPDRTLLKQNRGVRLRTSTNVATGAARHIITYKGPRAPGTLKRREEIEFAVDPPERAVAMLGALGYADMFLFEKRRESWHLDGCEIDLDELPRIGRFVEIEGPSEASILAVRAKLELDDAPSIVEPYIALLVRELERLKLPVREIRF